MNYDNKASMIHVCSPVMDMSTEDVWRLFSATDFPVSDIYDKMYEAGIPIEEQRTGSLLNFAAAKNISSVKTLEPDMYAKINARFQNIEFFSNFGLSGYYNIGKPADVEWNGMNHQKAGMSLDTLSTVSDIYEQMLKANNIKYNREQDNFSFPKENNVKLIKDTPLEDAINSGAEIYKMNNHDSYDDLLNKAKEGYIINSFRIIHTTWRDYCLYMLNTTKEPIKSIWREKMVTSILSWKYNTGSVPEPTLDAIKVLTELPSSYTNKLVDDYWEEDDWNTFGRLNISGKHVLSLSSYPQQSLEKEALICISSIIEDKDIEMLEKSERLKELAVEWNKKDGKTLTSLEATQKFIGKDVPQYEYVESPEEYGSDKFWANLKKAVKVWFKEEIHSTSSWKRFCIAILKNDVTLKYLGFAPTTTERVARANAVSAFSNKEDEKKKAEKEAKKLAKKIEKENN